MACILSLAAPDPAQTSLTEREARRERDRLTPHTHHLRSRTNRTRDARVIGEKLRDYWQAKAAKRGAA